VRVSEQSAVMPCVSVGRDTCIADASHTMLAQQLAAAARLHCFNTQAATHQGGQLGRCLRPGHHHPWGPWGRGDLQQPAGQPSTQVPVSHPGQSAQLLLLVALLPSHTLCSAWSCYFVRREVTQLTRGAGGASGAGLAVGSIDACQRTTHTGQ
jgi:hypothetical protein